MIFKAIPASAHLQTFVKDYLLLHYACSEDTPPFVKPFPANTDHCIVFYLQGILRAVEQKSGASTIYPKISINGPLITRYDFTLPGRYLMLAVTFQPGALSKFLRLPMTEFINEKIDGEAILNPEIQQLYERMSNAGSYHQIIHFAEEYLWKRIQKLKAELLPIDKVSRLVASRPSDITVEKMADIACLSVSQFERRFIVQEGINPKFFARINRFYQAYQLKDQNPVMDWLSVAMATGYHDYQHLVKDFKQFAGSTPQSLLDAQARSPERMLGIG